MGLFKQLMIFGKTGLQGLPTRVTLFLWAFSRQGLLGSPYSQHGILVAGSGRAPIPGNSGETFRAGADPGFEFSHLGLARQETETWGEVWTWAWILEAGLRVGGPGTLPFWRTREELCTVRNSAR